MSNPTSIMYTTIHRTPDDLRTILATGWGPAEEAARVLVGSVRVFVVGIGTSYHAAVNAAFHLRAAGSDAEAVSSYDFIVYPPELRPGDAVVVFSHRGFKQFSLAAMQRAKVAGVPVIVVTGIGSEADSADLALRTTLQEKSAAFTASHTGAMFVTAQVAQRLGAMRGIALATEEDFVQVPEQIEDLFPREPDIESIARRTIDCRMYAAGAGPDGALATELSLKAREAAYTTVDGLPTEQFIHGPLVTVGKGDFAILIATHEAGRKRTRDLLQILDTVGVESWIIGGLPDAPATATTFVLPDVPPILAPVLGVIPVQLLAGYQAQAKGTPGDSFRRDEPLYSETFAKVKL